MPVLIINLDGVIGYWDDYKKFYYIFRPKVIEALIQLSFDFRLVAVSSQRQKHIYKVIYGLTNLPGEDGNKSLVFDAVYQLCSQNEFSKFRSYQKNVDEVHFDLS